MGRLILLWRQLNLGEIKGMLIGVENTKHRWLPYNGEVWVNELRLSSLDEKAAMQLWQN
jgi:uncharacterized membrane protein